MKKFEKLVINLSQMDMEYRTIGLEVAFKINSRQVAEARSCFRAEIACFSGTSGYIKTSATRFTMVRASCDICIPIA